MYMILYMGNEKVKGFLGFKISFVAVKTQKRKGGREGNLGAFYTQGDLSRFTNFFVTSFLRFLSFSDFEQWI